MLEWRNWQTHGTQNPATFTGHVGSTPTSSTTILARHYFEKRDGSQPGNLRRILPHPTALFVVAALYTAGVLHSRCSAAEQGERQVTDAEAAEAINPPVWACKADARSIRAGQRLSTGYGVSNAVKVTIEPGVKELEPLVTRCMEAYPRKTATFTLTAEDAAGHMANGAGGEASLNA